MLNIFKLLELIYKGELSANKTKLLLCIVVELNRNRWRPVSITASVAGRGMGKDTFLKERRSLIDDGWIVMRPGIWKTAPAIYDLGPRFNDNNNDDKSNLMRNREHIKGLVIEIDKQYPDFSEFCAKYKWDRAVQCYKAEHPELATREWPADFIGDPVNRDQAHEMLVKLHKKKRPGRKTEKLAEPLGAWSEFNLFVDMWQLSYPKKATKAAVRAAVSEFRKGKELWTDEQVKGLQENITTHTAAYVASFGGDIRFMVSPANYFAAEKWTEKVSIIRDKNDLNYKMAGAPVKPNMPKMTTVFAGNNSK